jgi:hypothetical protein
MAKDPAFLFYSQDFLTGTYLMTDQQVGKYIRLLCLQHQKGMLTEKDMMKICETYDEDIFCKFEKENGLFYNKRLKFEAEKRSAYAESRRKNREKVIIKDMNNISKTYVPHMENENENENENEIVKEIVKEKFNFKKELLKIGFKENLVNEWLAVRKTKRATNTQTALNKFMEQVNKCKADKNSILELCVEKSWSGFKAYYYENSKNKLPFGEPLTAAHRYAFPPKQIVNG